MLRPVRKLQIAVIGYNKDRCTDIASKMAYEVGKEIACAGAVLICGGLGGVMESACKGAKEYGGTTVGIIPQEEFLYANEYGGIGTLIELGVGYMTKKTMVAISGSGSVADIYGGKFLDERNRVSITVAKDAKTAVEMILATTVKAR